MTKTIFFFKICSLELGRTRSKKLVSRIDSNLEVHESLVLNEQPYFAKWQLFGNFCGNFLSTLPKIHLTLKFEKYEFLVVFRFSKIHIKNHFDWSCDDHRWALISKCVLRCVYLKIDWESRVVLMICGKAT